jgi:hypothetical protein
LQIVVHIFHTLRTINPFSTICCVLFNLDSHFLTPLYSQRQLWVLDNRGQSNILVNTI